jgi:hypothetical protein
LTGILFFHRISDNRMHGAFPGYLSMLEMCGVNALPNVILTTTMWNEVEDEIGLRREEELRKLMMNNGYQIARFNYTHESAWEIINMIDINRPLKLRTEMVDPGKPLVQRSLAHSCSGSPWWKRIIAKLRKRSTGQHRRLSNDTSPMV